MATITKESLLAKRVQLVENEKKLTRDQVATNGAIQMLDILLKELEVSDTAESEIEKGDNIQCQQQS